MRPGGWSMGWGLARGGVVLGLATGTSSGPESRHLDSPWPGDKLCPYEALCSGRLGRGSEAAHPGSWRETRSLASRRLGAWTVLAGPVSPEASVLAPSPPSVSGRPFPGDASRVGPGLTLLASF